ncbi:hypothetical protein ACJX0J_019322 [Zea mays]
MTMLIEKHTNEEAEKNYAIMEMTSLTCIIFKCSTAHMRYDPSRLQVLASLYHVAYDWLDEDHAGKGLKKLNTSFLFVQEHGFNEECVHTSIDIPNNLDLWDIKVTITNSCTNKGYWMK